MPNQRRCARDCQTVSRFFMRPSSSSFAQGPRLPLLPRRPQIRDKWRGWRAGSRCLSTPTRMLSSLLPWSIHTHVDMLAAERREQPCGGAGVMDHAPAHRGNNAHIIMDGHGIGLGQLHNALDHTFAHRHKLAVESTTHMVSMPALDRVFSKESPFSSTACSTRRPKPCSLFIMAFSTEITLKPSLPAMPVMT